MDNSRLLIGNAIHFDRIHSKRDFDREAKRLARCFSGCDALDEFGCMSGELGHAIKRLGFAWRGYESRTDLRKMALEKHGEHAINSSISCAVPGSLTNVVGWYAPLTRVAPLDLDESILSISSALAVGGRAVLEDWLRPKEARSGWSLMDCYDGGDYKISRTAVAQLEGDCAVFAFQWLIAKVGEQPAFHQEQSVAWLHSEASLLNAFSRAGLRSDSLMVDGLRCWELTKL